MNIYFVITLLLTLIACNTSESPETITKREHTTITENAELVQKHSVPKTELSQTVMATLENGYIFRLHQLKPYLPKDPKPGSIFKPLDPAFDYFIADVSLENPGTETLDVGTAMLSFYFVLDDGTKVSTGLQSASLFARYVTDYSVKYDQKAYDMFFSSQFPPSAQSRSEVFAIAIPKGKKITGMGIYPRSKTKNKQVDIM